MPKTDDDPNSWRKLLGVGLPKATPAGSSTAGAGGSASSSASEGKTQDWRRLLDASLGKKAKPASSPAPAASQPTVQESTAESAAQVVTKEVVVEEVAVAEEPVATEKSVAADTTTSAEAGADIQMPDAKGDGANNEEEEETRELTAEELDRMAAEALKELDDMNPDKEVEEVEEVQEVQKVQEVEVVDTLEESDTALAAAALKELEDMDAEDAVDVEEAMDAGDAGDVEEAKEVVENVVEEMEVDPSEPLSSDRAAAWQQDLDDLEDGDMTTVTSAEVDVVDLEGGEPSASPGEPPKDTKIMKLQGKASGTIPPKTKSPGAPPPKVKSGGAPPGKPPFGGSPPGGKPVPQCPKGHNLVESKAEDHLCCDKCEGSIEPGTASHACRPCNYDLCAKCAAQWRPDQGKGAQKGKKGWQQSHGKAWVAPNSPAANSSGNLQRQQSGSLQRQNSAPGGKITPIKPAGDSGDLKRQNSSNNWKQQNSGNNWKQQNSGNTLQRNDSGKIQPIKPLGSNGDLQRQNSSTLSRTDSGAVSNNPLKRTRTDSSLLIAAKDAEGRQYDLQRIVVNFANVGQAYATKVMKRDPAKASWLFDWDGVRRCVTYLTKKLEFKVVGVIYENHWGTDRDSQQKVECPGDIKRMCESVEETPRIQGSNHSNADVEMTIKSAYHRNCRFMDNDNYKEWKQHLRDERCRKWLDNCQDLLQMRFFFDSGVGVFETLDGNIPPGLLAPEGGGRWKRQVTKKDLWTASNK